MFRRHGGAGGDRAVLPEHAVCCCSRPVVSLDEADNVFGPVFVSYVAHRAHVRETSGHGNGVEVPETFDRIPRGGEVERRPSIVGEGKHGNSAAAVDNLFHSIFVVFFGRLVQSCEAFVVFDVQVSACRYQHPCHARVPGSHGVVEGCLPVLRV